MGLHRKRQTMRKLQIEGEAYKEKVWTGILWLFSFLIHLAVINHFVGWFCTDTAGYWMHAATFTGHDWSEAAKSTSMYYSWGYSLWLIIPFLLAAGNMTVMARIAIAVNALFCSFTFVLSYALGKKIFHGVSRRLVMACAFIVSVYPTYILEASVALSESLLFFLYLLELWLIAEYLSSNRPKWAVGSGICCGYMYIVHHRTLGIVAAFFCMLLILYLKNRNWREVLYFLVPLLLCITASVLVDQWLAVKEMGDNLYTKNTYRAMAKRLPATLQLGRILTMVQNAIGEAWYILIGTFISAGMGIIFTCKKIRKMMYMSKSERRMEHGEALYFFAAFSLAFSIVISVYSTARNMGNTGGRIDAIFYGRYFENTLSFFVFTGLVQMGRLRKEQDAWKEAVLLVILTLAGSVAVYDFTRMINGNGINYFSVSALLSLYSYPNLDFSVLDVSLYHMAIILVIFYLLWMRKKVYTVAAYCLICASFLYTGFHAVVNVDNLCRDHALTVDYPTQNEEALTINHYIKENHIERFGVYSESTYMVFSYQLMNPQNKVYSLSSVDEIERLAGHITHVILPKSLKEMMTDAELELETENYVVCRLSDAEQGMLLDES